MQMEKLQVITIRRIVAEELLASVKCSSSIKPLLIGDEIIELNEAILVK
jgi:hypothetical protein